MEGDVFGNGVCMNAGLVAWDTRAGAFSEGVDVEHGGAVGGAK